MDNRPALDDQGDYIRRICEHETYSAYQVELGVLYQTIRNDMDARISDVGDLVTTMVRRHGWWANKTEHHLDRLVGMGLATKTCRADGGEVYRLRLSLEECPHRDGEITEIGQPLDVGQAGAAYACEGECPDCGARLMGTCTWDGADVEWADAEPSEGTA